MTKKVRLFLTMLFLTLLGGANAAWAADTWVKTAPSSLQTGDIVVIVDETSKKAMSNDNGASSAPTATAVTLVGDKITSTVGENIQWEVSVSNVNGTDYYSFKVYNTDNYLYCTNTNNGVRVGTSENTVFSIFNNDGVDFLLNETKDFSRYLGVYNSQNWRCYTSINTNINNTVTTFYKKVSASGPVDPSVTISAETVEVGKTITISGPSGLAMQFESDDESVATVSDEGVVTGVAAGEATITASWAANTDYNSGSQEFTVTVTAAVASTVYEKVTNANQLVAGNKYILVAEGSSMAMGKNNGKNRSNVSVTISNDEVEITNEEVAILTLGGNSGAWTLLASDDSKYLALTANSNELHASADASQNSSKWVITDDFQLETNAQSDTRYLRYNSGSPRFACYKSGQVEAYLYVKSGSSTNTKAEPGFSFSASTAEASLGGDFTAPEFSNPNNVTVSFTSSAPTVATIDESGNVTIVAAGTTTISATSEETDTYLAGTVSYTLTVTDPNAPGTENNPYTVEQARAAIDANTGVTGVYATGIVSEIVTAYNSQFGNITYNISADGSTTADQLQAYRGKSYNGDSFTSEDDIQVGDVVVIYGNLKKYNNTTYEFDANNQLVSLQREEVPSDKYYLAGSMTSWEDHKVEMTKKADGSYTLTGVEMAEGAEFKIIKMEIGATEPTWLGGQADGNQFWLTVENHKNIPLVAGANFYMPIAGTWDITVSFDADNNPLITVDGSWPEVEYYLTGDFNTWTASDDNYKFTKQNDGTYKLTTNISGNFKVYDSLDHWYGATADGSYWITADNHTDIEMTDQAANYNLETANDYTFIVNPDTKKLTVTGWPIVLDGNAFVKVTSTDELEDGYYLIVYEGNDDHASVAFNGGLEELDAANNGLEVKIAEKLIVANSTTIAAAFIIEKSSDSYTIKSSSNNYIGRTAYQNGLDASETTAYINTIDFADGNAAITAITGSGNCTLRYNYASDQARFRYYKSGQQPIALYKLTTVEEIPVTIGATGYATLYYSDKALAVPEGVTASTASVADKNITLADTEGFVPAGTGVVLNGEQGEYTFLVVPESTAEPIKDNMLSGSDEAATTTGGGKYYMMSLDKNGENVGFYYGAAKGGAFTNGAHKAYLVVPDATAGAKSFYLFSEAETTGIGSVQSTMFNDGRMEIFNLNGQRVSTPQRGIYIVNGKKVLVK